MTELQSGDYVKVLHSTYDHHGNLDIKEGTYWKLDEKVEEYEYDGELQPEYWIMDSVDKFRWGASADTVVLEKVESGIPFQVLVEYVVDAVVTVNAGSELEAVQHAQQIDLHQLVSGEYANMGNRQTHASIYEP